MSTKAKKQSHVWLLFVAATNHVYRVAFNTRRAAQTERKRFRFPQWWRVTRVPVQGMKRAAR